MGGGGGGGEAGHREWWSSVTALVWGGNEWVGDTRKKWIGVDGRYL